VFFTLHQDLDYILLSGVLFKEDLFELINNLLNVCFERL